MKTIHLYSWSKDNDREFNDTITWNSDEELKNKIDNFHIQKNQMSWENVHWAFYTTEELTSRQEDIIGVNYGDRLKQLK
jgi:hypothetical protein